MPSLNWNPERYERSARFVSELGRPLVELLAPRPHERILDLGCGDGALTEEIAARADRVIGVDASPEMVTAARARGVDARVMNGEQLEFRSEFHAVFSNAALHWMRRPDEVIRGVWQALQPGGRFVAEMGGHENLRTVFETFAEILYERGLSPEKVNRHYFPTAEEHLERLESRGFELPLLEVFDRPTPLAGSISDWLAMVAGPYLGAVAARDRDDVLAEVCARLRPRLVSEHGRWIADYVRLRFVAIKPAT